MRLYYREVVFVETLQSFMTLTLKIRVRIRYFKIDQKLNIIEISNFVLFIESLIKFYINTEGSRIFCTLGVKTGQTVPLKNPTRCGQNWTRCPTNWTDRPDLTPRDWIL